MHISFKVSSGTVRTCSTDVSTKAVSQNAQRTTAMQICQKTNPRAYMTTINNGNVNSVDYTKLKSPYVRQFSFRTNGKMAEQRRARQSIDLEYFGLQN